MRNVKLNSREKKDQTVLRILLILIAIVIAKGIYNDSHHINQDYILMPLVLNLSALFCIIYSINAFTTGNIVYKWAATSIFSYIFLQVKRRTTKTDDEAIKFTIRLFGFFVLFLAAIAFIKEVVFFLVK